MRRHTWCNCKQVPAGCARVRCDYGKQERVNGADMRPCVGQLQLRRIP